MKRLLFQLGIPDSTHSNFLICCSVPNVVRFYGAFQNGNHYYIVMELCSGGDLLELLLRDKKFLSERRAAVHVMQPLLTTLASLHSRKIIHRDIKLENIFLDSYGKIRLGDFGLTMCMQQEAAISPVGTTEYMAPGRTQSVNRPHNLLILLK